jgi:hypothetical protein
MTCYNSELPIGPPGPVGPQGPQGPSGNALGYKVYSALLTQNNSDAPVANILENTLGFTPTWVRDAAGFYTSNNAEWITPAMNGKVMTFMSPVAYQTIRNFFRISASFFSPYIVIITGNYNETTDTFTFLDNLLRDEDNYQHTSIEIRVYN